MTPHEALEFLDTGIDMLAPAFGNVHGEYVPKGPRAFLQFDRLKGVQNAVKGNPRTLAGWQLGVRRSACFLAGGVQFHFAQG